MISPSPLCLQRSHVIQSRIKEIKFLDSKLGSTTALGKTRYSVLSRYCLVFQSHKSTFDSQHASLCVYLRDTVSECVFPYSLLHIPSTLKKLPGFERSTSIAYHQALSTDSDLNANIDCYRSAMEIWLNLLPICQQTVSILLSEITSILSVIFSHIWLIVC